MEQNESTLDDIAVLYNNPIDSTSDEKGMNGRLKELNDSLKKIEEVEKNGISRQSDVKQIIDNEVNRLDEKKKTIDEAILSQNRIIYFNDNTRKIYSAYLKMLIVFVITLAIIYLILLFDKTFGIFPKSVNEIMIIAAISISIIICYNMYGKIRYRNLYNFDEIDYAAPTKRPETQKIKSSDLTIDISSTCIGSACCNTSEGATWDETLGKCVSSLDTTAPTEAFEYENYSVYK